MFACGPCPTHKKEGITPSPHVVWGFLLPRQGGKKITADTTIGRDTISTTETAWTVCSLQTEVIQDEGLCRYGRHRCLQRALVSCSPFLLHPHVWNTDSQQVPGGVGVWSCLHTAVSNALSLNHCTGCVATNRDPQKCVLWVSTLLKEATCCCAQGMNTASGFEMGPSCGTQQSLSALKCLKEPNGWFAKNIHSGKTLNLTEGEGETHLNAIIVLPWHLLIFRGLDTTVILVW